VRHILLPALLIAALVTTVQAHTPPLLPEKDVAALANELSGETAKRNLEGLARFHRQRGSQGFHAAAELVAASARAYGLSNVEILQFPADGKIFYGTQLSRQAWDAEEGELSEVKETGEASRSAAGPLLAGQSPANQEPANSPAADRLLESRIASYSAEPIVLAEDSESGDVTANLVDVGDGTKDSDYAGKDVAGKLVLVAAPASAAQDIAIGQYHAAGIISYAQNQSTAWSGGNDNLIRWGHLESFSPNKTFAFMVSLRTARALQDRLRRGENIRLHARVQAGQHPAFYEVVTATIEGADPKLKETEIAFSCHLDHQRPGANDNASGCVTILEVARTLQKLIASGTLTRPARTIRFIWPPEIEGTVTLLNAKPEFARRIKVAIHMDMVGGGLDTKSVFHVTRGPSSLPSFVHDVAWAIADWINTESYEFAASGEAQYPLTAPEGGKEPLRADYAPFELGSDHQVYQDSSFGIPSIYLNDWPDRYIHTNFDTAANIDPTKLKRAALIGAASAYFLANFSQRDVAVATRAVQMGRLERSIVAHRRGTPEAPVAEYERKVVNSLNAFGSKSAPKASGESKARADGTPVFRRRPQPRGPLSVFGYDYFDEHAKAAGVPTPRLLSYAGEWGSAEAGYAYEALNFADGKHSARQIADELSAEYGPIPPELVLEYLQALKSIGIVE
jgi:aminopeptidase YwaD